MSNDLMEEAKIQIDAEYPDAPEENKMLQTILRYSILKAGKNPKDVLIEEIAFGKDEYIYKFKVNKKAYIQTVKDFENGIEANPKTALEERAFELAKDKEYSYDDLLKKLKAKLIK